MANLGDNNTPVEGESFGLPSGFSIDENSGNLAIRDINGNVVAEWDETNAEWDFANNTLNNVDALNSNSVNTEQLKNNPHAPEGMSSTRYSRPEEGEPILGDKEKIDEESFSGDNTPSYVIDNIQEYDFNREKPVVIEISFGGGSSPSDFRMRINDNESQEYRYTEVRNGTVTETEDDTAFEITVDDFDGSFAGYLTLWVPDSANNQLILGSSVSVFGGGWLGGYIDASYGGGVEKIELLFDDDSTPRGRMSTYVPT